MPLSRRNSGIAIIGRSCAAAAGFVFCLVFTFSGCSQPAAPMSEGRLHACALIDLSSVEDLFPGGAPEPREESLQSPDRKMLSSTCRLGANSEGASNIILLSVRRGQPQTTLADYNQEMRSVLGDAYAPQHLKDLGDSNAWFNPLRQLVVFEGPAMLVITMAVGSSEDDLKRAAERVARYALGRLRELPPPPGATSSTGEEAR